MKVTNDVTLEHFDPNPQVHDDYGQDIDVLVAAWVLHRFRQEHSYSHLAGCPGTSVVFDAYDGMYGCDTGCDYVRLESVVVCPHEKADYDYGEFGELDDLLRDVLRFAGRR